MANLKSLAWVVSLALSLTDANARDLEIATGEYEPFTGAALDGLGSVNSRVSEYARQANLGISYSFMPWKRALEATRRGRFDASVFWYHSDEREADFIHVGPILEDRLVFFRRIDADIPTWQNLAGLEGLRIGIVPGYTYTSEFWALVDQGVLTVSEGPTDLANLRKLVAGRIDLFPVSEEAGWHLLRQNFDAEELALIDVEAVPLSVTHGYLLVSRAVEDAAGIANALQKAVDQAASETGAATN